MALEQSTLRLLLAAESLELAGEGQRASDAYRSLLQTAPRLAAGWAGFLRCAVDRPGPEFCRALLQAPLSAVDLAGLVEELVWRVEPTQRCALAAEALRHGGPRSRLILPAALGRQAPPEARAALLEALAVRLGEGPFAGGVAALAGKLALARQLAAGDPTLELLAEEAARAEGDWSAQARWIELRLGRCRATLSADPAAPPATAVLARHLAADLAGLRLFRCGQAALALPLLELASAEGSAGPLPDAWLAAAAARLDLPHVALLALDRLAARCSAALDRAWYTALAAGAAFAAGQPAVAADRAARAAALHDGVAPLLAPQRLAPLWGVGRGAEDLLQDWLEALPLTAPVRRRLLHELLQRQPAHLELQARLAGAGAAEEPESDAVGRLVRSATLSLHELPGLDPAGPARELLLALDAAGDDHALALLVLVRSLVRLGEVPRACALLLQRIDGLASPALGLELARRALALSWQHPVAGAPAAAVLRWAPDDCCAGLRLVDDLAGRPGRGELHQGLGRLAVRLPLGPAERDALLAWGADLAEEEGALVEALETFESLFRGALPGEGEPRSPVPVDTWLALRIGSLLRRLRAPRDLAVFLLEWAERTDDPIQREVLLLRAWLAIEGPQRVDALVQRSAHWQEPASALAELALAWEALGEPARGLSLVEGAVGRWPTALALHRTRVLLLRRLGSTTGLGEALAQLAAVEPEPRLAAVALTRLARLQQGDAQLELAQRSFEAALRADPCCTPALRDLSRLLARRGQRGLLGRLLHAAVAHHRQRLVAEPFDGRRLRALREALRLAGEQPSAERMQRLLEALGEELPTSRTRVGPALPSRPFDQASLELLLHPGLSRPLVAMLQALEPWSGRLLPVDHARRLPARDGHTPLPAGHPLVRLAAPLAELYGMALPELYLAPPGLRSSRGAECTLDPPGLVLGRELVAEASPPQLAFFLGGALLRHRLGLTLLARLEGAERRELLLAVVQLARAGLPEERAAASPELLGQVGRAVPAQLLRSLAPHAAALLREGLPRVSDSVPHWAQVQDVRGGLLAVGDPAVALGALLHLRGAPPLAGFQRNERLALFRESPAIVELVRFASSAEYAALVAPAG